MNYSEEDANQYRNAYIRNYTKDMILAEIGFKQVEPLRNSMEANGGVFSFESDNSDHVTELLKYRIEVQKRGYARLIKDLNRLDSLNLSEKLQDYIFSFSKTLVKYALKYGYANEAVGLLKIMKNEKLVGKNATSEQHGQIVSFSVSRVLAILGLQYERQGDPEIRSGAINLMASVKTGEFGKAPELSEEKMTQVFLNPHETFREQKREEEKTFGSN